MWTTTKLIALSKVHCLSIIPPKRMGIQFNLLALDQGLGIRITNMQSLSIILPPKEIGDLNCELPPRPGVRI